MNLKEENFNSTVVRLRQLLQVFVQVNLIYFNSTVVRLRRCLRLVPKSLKTYFNSTVVRLRPPEI